VTIRHLLHHAGHFLRAAAPPVVVLGLLTAVRTVEPALVSDGVLGISWLAAAVASTAWLLIALAVAAARPRRDRRAHERLQQFRHLATQPDHALVQVQTTVWSTVAGQHAVVLNIVTGALHRVWLPETTVPVGAFAVLQRTGDGARVVARLSARSVEAAHRCERRTVRPADARRHEDREMQSEANEAPSPLILEIEAFLKGSADSR
jgi:hypothetical protein